MITKFLNNSWNEVVNSNTIKHLIFVIVTLAVSSLVLVILRKIATKLINSNADKIKVDPTNFSFIKNSLSFIIYFIALIVIFRHIPSLRSFSSALFAGAGIIAAIIGFASQKAFSNIITGIFILIFKPYRVGDVIEISNGRIGSVEEITLRHTVIKDFKNKRIIVPNTVISDDIIINSSITDSKIQCRIEVGISYDSDIDLAMQIMREECEKHPLLIDNRTPEEIKKGEPIVRVAVIALADFSVNLRASAWTESFSDAFQMRTDLLKIIKERFDREGVEIPFPYRTIVNKKDMEKK